MASFLEDSGDLLSCYISHGGKDLKDGVVFLRKG